MASYYIDSTLGNDTTGSGTFASPWATMAKAYTVLAASDEIILRGGKTYTLTSTLNASLNITISTYFGDSSKATIACGAFSFGGTATNITLNRIITTANNSVVSPNYTSTSTTTSFFVRDCEFYNMVRLGSGRLTIEDTIIDPADVSGHSTCFATGTPIISAFNCYFTKPISSTGTANNNNFWFRGCIFNFTGKSFNITHVVNQTTALTQGFGLFDFCNFFGMDAIVRYNSATSVSSGDYAINRSCGNPTNIIQNIGAGVLTIDNSPSSNNIFATTTSKTNFTDYNSTTTTDFKFYDLAGGDLHIEYDSPLADYNGDTVGAYVLEKPSVFFDTLPEAKVENAYAYKAGSRTNNKTGTLSSAGETDANKVLNTSTIITGLYVPPSNTNVKVGVNFGVTDTGTYDGSDRHTDPGESNVRSGTTYKSNSTTNNKTGTAAIPTASDVRLGTATDATTGTLNLPAEADVKSGVTYDNATKTGSFDPITGSWEAVAAADLRSGITKKQNGSNVIGLLDLPAISNVKKDIVYDNLTKTGTLDLPSLSSVLPTDTLEGSSGTADVNALANLPDPTDVLTGSGNYGKDLDIVPSYSPDFPSVNSVLTTDTTNGVQGTVTLPTTSQVKDGVLFGPNNSLEGTVEELDLTKFTDVPVDKVEAGYDYKYNSATNNREGTADIGASSTDPGEWNVLKDVNYVINGTNLTGKYQTGELQQTAGDNIRIQILKEIENTLYRVNPAVSAVYQNTIKTVSLESGLKQGVIQDDMPFVQIIADENSYDHKFVLSGNKPQVNMRVKFLIITPSNWNLIDNESLYEDIRQAFIRDNFTLNGLVLSVKVIGVKQINSDSDKADDNRRAEMSLEFIFIEQITNLN